MNDEQFRKEILVRLDALIKLSTISSMKDQTQKEKIILLDSVGFGPKQISETLNTSSNTVNVALSNLRKKTQKKEVEDAKQTNNSGLEREEENNSTENLSSNQG